MPFKYQKFFSIFYKVFAYYIIAFFALLAYEYFNKQVMLFSEKNILQWDAVHYYTIKNYGYKGFLTAFFPMFPLVWKALNIGVVAMSLFNGFIYISAATMLIYFFEIEKREMILLLSTPSIIFMFLPYTESLFFLCGTLILVGLERNLKWLIVLSLLICSMVRPTATVFIPALILLEWLSKGNKFSFANTFYYCAATVLGMLLVFYIQYLHTNEWFSFFTVQKSGWNNQLQFPVLPLRSWAGNSIVKLDGVALMVGIISIIYLVLLFLKKIEIHSKALVFSILYLSGISLLILFFRGGSLFSLNRFVFATPFYFVFFNHFLKNRTWSNKDIVVLFLVISLYWLLFGSYVHIQALLKFELTTLFVLLVFMQKTVSSQFSKVSYYLLLAGFVLLQLFFYQRFLNGGWIG
jgi:hypothetical protein